MSEILKDLREQIAERRAVLVVGTGVSLAATGGATTASWTGLLESGVERCLEIAAGLPADWKETRLLQIRSGDTHELISAAEEIVRRLGGSKSGEFLRWLREDVGSLHPRSQEPLAAIRDLELPAATTNYDGLLEESLELPPVTWQRPERALRVLRGEERGILHLHGFWEEPASLVLGARSYDEVLADVPTQVVQQMLVLGHSLVFVGCGAGLADPNLGSLLRWLETHWSGTEHRHFRLCLDRELEALQRARGNGRVFPVAYGERHEDLVSFLRGLRGRGRPKPASLSPRPEPAYADPDTRTLALELEELAKRLEEETIAGRDTRSTLAAIAERKLRMREGGRLKPGDYLGQRRYHLLEVLGKGGFGTVWKAWDQKLGKLVAVKVLLSDHGPQGLARIRFFRGARQMVKIGHQAVVKVLEEEREEEGYCFFVMEYLAGGDLRAAVISQRIGTDAALEAVLAIAEALQAAHEMAIIHRDVKPANILLDGAGRPKLGDFDLVRAPESAGATFHGQQMGEFCYSAPEVLAGADQALATADVYSLGMTLAFVLHGEDPSPATIFQRAEYLAAVPCSTALRGVLLRATALSPADRFPSVRALVAAVREALAAPAAPRSEPASRPAPSPARSVARTSTSPDSLLRALSKGEPGERLTALVQLREQHSADASDLLERLPKGRELRDLLEQGFASPPEMDRAHAVATVIEVAMARISEGIDTAGISAWALDYFVLRSASDEQRRRGSELRRALVRLLRSKADPPDLAAEWVSIPAGKFTMGSPVSEGLGDERPAHSVTLSAFRMSRYLVTNRLLRALRKSQENDDLPAVRLSWYEAYGYAAWLGGRLPTEAEWEYAARADSPHAYSDRRGNATTLDKVGWYDKNSGKKLQPIGKLEPNPFGLFDTYGNAWEWTADWYAPYSAEPKENPWGLPRGEDRVLRGGSAWSGASWARAACRNFWLPGDVFRGQGFRVVLPGPPS